MLLALGLVPLALVPGALRDWHQMCRGGRDNPNYCVNACGDMESLMIVMPMLIAVALIPAALFVLGRALADHRKAQRPDESVRR